MIKDRLQIARGSAARITSFLNSFRDYEIIFNTDTNRLGIVLPDKTIVYIGALDINDAFEEDTYIESIEVDSESPNVLNITRKPIPNPDLTNYYTKDDINSMVGDINSILASILGV
jgi:hypothetical protein